MPASRKPAAAQKIKKSTETDINLEENMTLPLESPEKDDYITVDLTTFVLPISILASAVIMSLVLIFGIRSINTKVDAAKIAILDAIDASGSTAEDTGGAEEAKVGTVTIGNSPFIGDLDKATLAIVEFSDYECPFCKRHDQQTFEQLKKNYVDTGKAIYVYRNNIVIESHNPIATEQALAGLCIQDLAGDEAYFTYRGRIYDTSPGNGQGQKATLYALASELGVSSTAFATCLDSKQFQARVDQDMEDAADAGLDGTPGFVVGALNEDGTVEGDLIRGAYPYATFQEALDKYL